MSKIFLTILALFAFSGMISAGEVKADEKQLQADIAQLEADKKAHNHQAVKADYKKIRHDIRKLNKALHKKHHKHHHHVVKPAVVPSNTP